ncbi:bifunctional DNA primase/polymerase [Streptosporangium sp. NPDC050855]|uniref:bifunctional DNA primase/polymerase n=1 Tax=Streptosporangium sp. NPDC050855 TaxID=3366194 RepID=UPI003796D712
MVGVPLVRRRRRHGRPRQVLDAVLEYAALGWASCLGARPLTGGSRSCSCDRVGCPDPGAHPLSQTWQMEASTDPALLSGWWRHDPEANVVLPTGRVFDVFDVPLAAGRTTLATMDSVGVVPGPVAVNGDRALFYVATRNASEDEDEWWSCALDVGPSVIDEMPGLRWHCRDSYVLAPPSLLPTGLTGSWLRPPDNRPLPDPLRVLELLADVCD